MVLLSAQQECTWFCSDLTQCGEAYQEDDTKTKWLKKNKFSQSWRINEVGRLGLLFNHTIIFYPLTSSSQSDPNSQLAADLLTALNASASVCCIPRLFDLVTWQGKLALFGYDVDSKSWTLLCPMQMRLLRTYWRDLMLIYRAESRLNFR